MILRTIITILLLFLIGATVSVVNDTFNVTIENQLAVGQVEDSDFNAIAVRKAGRVAPFVNLIGGIVSILMLYGLWNKPIKLAIAKAKEQPEGTS